MNNDEIPVGMNHRGQQRHHTPEELAWLQQQQQQVQCHS
jgi:hypothetical protein